MFGIRYKSGNNYYWFSYDQEFNLEDAKFYYESEDAVAYLREMLLEECSNEQFREEWKNTIFEVVDLNNLTVVSKFEAQPFDPLKQVE